MSWLTNELVAEWANGDQVSFNHHRDYLKGISQQWRGRYLEEIGVILSEFYTFEPATKARTDAVFEVLKNDLEDIGDNDSIEMLEKAYKTNFVSWLILSQNFSPEDLATYLCEGFVEPSEARKISLFIQGVSVLRNDKLAETVQKVAELAQHAFQLRATMAVLQPEMVSTMTQAIPEEKLTMLVEQDSYGKERTKNLRRLLKLYLEGMYDDNKSSLRSMFDVQGSTTPSLDFIRELENNEFIDKRFYWNTAEMLEEEWEADPNNPVFKEIIENRVKFLSLSLGVRELTIALIDHNRIEGDAELKRTLDLRNKIFSVRREPPVQKQYDIEIYEEPDLKSSIAEELIIKFGIALRQEEFMALLDQIMELENPLERLEAITGEVPAERQINLFEMLKTSFL